ncbi:MAG: hypothetical protein MJK04_09510, partial [Psychrosphaera sp.]|nr:hypothetical protein [Psychrosphaera sp.]
MQHYLQIQSKEQVRANEVIALLLRSAEQMKKDDYYQPLTIGPSYVIKHINARLQQNLHTVVGLCKRKLNDFAEIVIYPSSARGDMNAYKYVNEVALTTTTTTTVTRVFTIIYFIDNAKDKKNLVQNGNMRAFVDHLDSQPSIATSDYIFLPHTVVEDIRAILRFDDQFYPTSRLVDYDHYDCRDYQNDVLKAAQKQFKLTAQLEPCKQIVNDLLISKQLQLKKTDYLVIINVNGRTTKGDYDAREQRHSTDPQMLEAFITAVKNNPLFAVMLTGDEPTNLKRLLIVHPNLINATKLWLKKANRHQQRSIMYM